jgi:hypothetical protein
VKTCRRSSAPRLYSLRMSNVFCGAFERSFWLSVRFFDHV